MFRCHHNSTVVTNDRYQHDSQRITGVNTLMPRQHGRHFADDTFKPIFLNTNIQISIKMSPMFVPKDPINNIPALVQIMAWRRSGDEPLSEPRMVRLSTHICVTGPQWVNIAQKNSLQFILRCVTPSLITGNSTDCTKRVQASNKKNIKALSAVGFP